MGGSQRFASPPARTGWHSGPRSHQGPMVAARGLVRPVGQGGVAWFTSPVDTVPAVPSVDTRGPLDLSPVTGSAIALRLWQGRAAPAKPDPRCLGDHVWTRPAPGRLQPAIAGRSPRLKGPGGLASPPGQMEALRAPDLPSPSRGVDTPRQGPVRPSHRGSAGAEKRPKNGHFWTPAAQSPGGVGGLRPLT